MSHIQEIAWVRNEVIPQLQKGNFTEELINKVKQNKYFTYEALKRLFPFLP